MRSLIIDVDVMDLGLTDDDVRGICKYHGFSCKKSGETETLGVDDIAAILDAIEMRIWQPDDWERLQNAVANAVSIPRRRAG